MIKITLKNFRKFTKAEFVFDKKFSLISGKSGCGKTTIFMAIIFALTGEGKNVQTRGKTSCSVILRMKGFAIERTKRPNRLRLKESGNDKIWEDREAQALIDKYFSQYITGYMSQIVDGSKSFLMMTSTDKIKFLEKMAFGDEKVDVLLSKCKILMNDRKKELLITEKQRETMEKMLCDMKMENVDSKKYLSMDEKKLMKELEECVYEYEKTKKELTKSEQIEQMRSKILSQLRAIPDVDENEEELDLVLRKYRDEKRRWNLYVKEKNKLVKPKTKMSVEEIDERVASLQKFVKLESKEIEILDLQKKEQELSKKIDRSKVKSECPSCKILLTVDRNGSLYVCDDGTKCKGDISVDVRELESKRLKIMARLESMKESCLELEELRKSWIGVDPSLEIKTLMDCKRKLLEYEKQKVLCKSLKVCEPEDIDVNELEDKLRTIRLRKEKENLLENLQECKDPNIVKEFMHRADESIRSFKKDVECIKSAKQWKKVEEFKKIENELNVSYPRSVLLHELIKESEKKAMCDVIDQINLHSQIYIDEFMDSNLSVSLAFDGSRLLLNVKHEGHDCNLNNLSGGEIARVILAFTIAIAEINNVELLLLDECVASLDADSTEQVLTTIRSSFKGTVICIAHQITTGVFDHVLELE